jgi:large subunit ribosomal protein L6
MIYSFRAHLRNMFKGVVEPWVYKMKICSGHFPMNVAIQGDKLVVKNFLGEKVPRILNIKPGVKVTVQDKDVTVESVDKELAGCTASGIELLLTIRGRDLRKFQDGIYIINKAGKEIEK